MRIGLWLHHLNTQLMISGKRIGYQLQLNYIALSIILINMFTFCKKHHFKQITKASGRTHSHFFGGLGGDLIYLSIFYYPESPPALLQMTLKIPCEWSEREGTLIFNGERVIASFRIVSLLLPLFGPSAQTIQIRHFLISLVNSVSNWFFSFFILLDDFELMISRENNYRFLTDLDILLGKCKIMIRKLIEKLVT